MIPHHWNSSQLPARITVLGTLMALHAIVLCAHFYHHALLKTPFSYECLTCLLTVKLYSVLLIPKNSPFYYHLEL